MRHVARIDTARFRAQQRLESQVAERTGELRELASYLMTAREDERGRLARELHDELGALLAAIKLDLARAAHRGCAFHRHGAAGVDRQAPE